jgi:hypothetical protein
MADLIAAETSCEGAVTGSTHENHAWLWHQFIKYLQTIGINHNVFLNSFTRSQQNKIIGNFAIALWEERFPSAAHDTLALGTIQKYHLGYICDLQEKRSTQPNQEQGPSA